jgi:hypothetical protein
VLRLRIGLAGVLEFPAKPLQVLLVGFGKVGSFEVALEILDSLALEVLLSVSSR